MRELDWEGGWNVRDLGALRTADGELTRSGSFVRSATLHRMTAAGWDAALAYGVRSIVDVRSPEEREKQPTRAPDEVTVIETPLEDGLMEDPTFLEWGQNGVLATPLYYAPYLESWGERCAPMFDALAAAPGVAVFHCSAGTDRTGMISAMLLQLADVVPDVIVEDYLLSRDNVQGQRARALGVHDPTEGIDATLAERGLTLRGAIEGFLGGLSAADFMTDATAAALRARLR